MKRFKITHNVSKNNKICNKKIFVIIYIKEDLENKCNTFIEDIKHYIAQYGQENIYNSDQSGFQLEMHSGRTLAHKGVKKIERNSSTVYISNDTQLYYTADYFR